MSYKHDTQKPRQVISRAKIMPWHTEPEEYSKSLSSIVDVVEINRIIQPKLLMIIWSRQGFVKSIKMYKSLCSVDISLYLQTD